jgi:DNA processing protein
VGSGSSLTRTGGVPSPGDAPGAATGSLPGPLARWEAHASEPDLHLLALVVLRALPGIGDRIAGRLLVEEGSRGGALLRVLRGGEGVPAPATRALRAEGELRVARAAAVLRLARREGIGALGVDEARYPMALAVHLHDPPALLWYRGQLELLDRPAVAVVGARRPSTAGRRMACRLAEELGGRGYTVVSGMASGIDAAAHRGAVETPTSTIAVLGRGPDRPYPLKEADLFHRIASQGLLLSEFAPRVPARGHHFPRRNRILAALSQAVVVVEAAARSGSLITVDHALDMGIPAMAMPGTADLETTVGSNGLLRDGAPLVTQADDVVAHLQADGGASVEDRFRSLARARAARRLQEAESGEGESGVPGASEAEEGVETAQSPSPLPETLSREDPIAAQVAGFLSHVPLPVEYLLEHSGLPPSRALQALTVLELAGFASRVAAGWVRVDPAPRPTSHPGDPLGTGGPGGP